MMCVYAGVSIGRGQETRKGSMRGGKEALREREGKEGSRTVT